MKKTRLISLLLVLAMIISVAPSAFAADTSADAVEEYLGTAQSDKPSFELDTSVQLPMIMPTAFGRWEASDTLGATGDTKYHGYAMVAPNQILQATLVNPSSASLDYDLYLIEADPSTGALLNIIESSDFGTYLNGGKTMDEKIGLINTTSTTRLFAFAVVAGIGGTTGQYTFKYSVSDTFDSSEWDGNPYYAKNISAPSNSSVTINNRTINTPDDDDWFIVNLPSSRQYTGVTFSLDATSRADGYSVEIYAVQSGNRMQRLGANTTISNTSGNHYVRVYPTDSNKVNEARNYTLTLTPVFPAANISITTIVNSNGSVAPNVVYSNVSNVARPRVERSWTTVNGRVTDVNGNGVSNVEVNLTWISGGWPEGSSSNMRTATVTTDSNGNYSAQVNLPPPAAVRSQFIPGAINFTHYFDECLFDVEVVGTGVWTDRLAYQFAYSI